QFRSEEGQAGDVSARLRKGRHEPILDGIAHHRCNNRNSGSCLPGGKGGRRIRREDDVNLETNQLRCESWKPLDSPVRTSVLDGDVSILRIAKLTQPLPEGVELHSRLGGFQRTGYHQTNPRDFRRWLSIHGQRQGGRRAAESQDELAAPHSITSSARSRIAVDGSMPVALAVFRFTTSSNFVGCSMGKSAGLAPRAIRSTNSATRPNSAVMLGP